MPKPSKPKDDASCVKCGALTVLVSGLRRCQRKSCGYLHDQGYAFQEAVTYDPQAKYPPYERVHPKPVDEEFK